jgi:hypothetical protein
MASVLGRKAALVLVALTVALALPPGSAHADIRGCDSPVVVHAQGQLIGHPPCAVGYSCPTNPGCTIAVIGTFHWVAGSMGGYVLVDNLVKTGCNASTEGCNASESVFVWQGTHVISCEVHDGAAVLVQINCGYA